MRSVSLPRLALAALVAVAAPVAAQTVETLLLETSLESQLLVEALGRYRSARQAERDALARVAELSDQLDGRLERSEAAPTELRRLEADLVAAAGVATARLDATARARAEIYRHRARLGLLEQRLAQVGGGPLLPDSGVSGLWQVQIEPGEIFGLMRIQADGTLLTGTYVLSNGDQGSVRGTVVDDAVTIERIDSTRGFTSTLEGELDAPRGRLEGTWTGKDLTAGEPTTGTWIGRRLTASEAPRPRG